MSGGGSSRLLLLGGLPLRRPGAAQQPDRQRRRLLAAARRQLASVVAAAGTGRRHSPPSVVPTTTAISRRGLASKACPTAAELRRTLGAPIPLDEHAVSVTMPKWSHVVGYEEGDPSVTDRLVLGYPRFVFHPFVKQLVEVWKQRAVEAGEVGAHEVVGALPLPSRAAAERCRRFLLAAHAKEPGFPVRVHSLGVAGDGAYMVSFPAKAAGEAKACWQHAGEILSSRHARRLLTSLQGHPPPDPTAGFPLPGAGEYGEGARRRGGQGGGGAVMGAGDFGGGVQEGEEPATTGNGNHRQALRARLAGLTGQKPQDVQLTLSGMAAIFHAFRLCQRARPGRKVVVFGFTYLDTLKICRRAEWNPPGVHFLGRGDARDVRALEEILRGEEVMGLFTEFPSNPLLQTPDLAALSSLGRRYGFPVVVDDTIANAHNVDLLRPSAQGGVDATATSLTKLFSGRGDVMAGALVLNGRGHLYPQLRAAAEQLCAEESGEGGDAAELYEGDAAVCLRNGLDFEARSRRINATTEALVDWLAGQPGVQQLFYPKLTQRALYDAYRRPGGGYGGLFSLSLQEGRSPTAFYDALDVYKGPSLGTNYTLACPYTLLAHYNELDFAMAHGVCPNLVRVSVGLEDLEQLKHAFAAALDAAARPPPPGVCRTQWFPPGLHHGGATQ